MNMFSWKLTLKEEKSLLSTGQGQGSWHPGWRSGRTFIFSYPCPVKQSAWFSLTHCSVLSLRCYKSMCQCCLAVDILWHSCLAIVYDSTWKGDFAQICNGGIKSFWHVILPFVWEPAEKNIQKPVCDILCYAHSILWNLFLCSQQPGGKSYRYYLCLPVFLLTFVLFWPRLKPKVLHCIQSVILVPFGLSLSCHNSLCLRYTALGFVGCPSVLVGFSLVKVFSFCCGL